MCYIIFFAFFFFFFLILNVFYYTLFTYSVYFILNVFIEETFAVVLCVSFENKKFKHKKRTENA